MNCWMEPGVQNSVWRKLNNPLCISKMGRGTIYVGFGKSTTKSNGWFKIQFDDNQINKLFRYHELLLN